MVNPDKATQTPADTPAIEISGELRFNADAGSYQNTLAERTDTSMTRRLAHLPSSHQDAAVWSL